MLVTTLDERLVLRNQLNAYDGDAAGTVKNIDPERLSGAGPAAEPAWRWRACDKAPDRRSLRAAPAPPRATWKRCGPWSTAATWNRAPMSWPRRRGWPAGCSAMACPPPAIRAPSAAPTSTRPSRCGRRCAACCARTRPPLPAQSARAARGSPAGAAAPTGTDGPDRADPGPAAELGRIAAGLVTRFEVTGDGRIGVQPAGPGVPGALARILLIAADAAAAGTWPRLKACAADDCQWAFYDRSPTRTGCWCSMQVCGARAKSRAYRQRASRAGRPAPGAAPVRPAAAPPARSSRGRTAR